MIWGFRICLGSISIRAFHLLKNSTVPTTYFTSSFRILFVQGTVSTVTLLLPLKKTVWRIRDVYPGSRILIFTHPGSRIQKQQQK
jgi:hypothetical protein